MSKKGQVELGSEKAPPVVEAVKSAVTDESTKPPVNGPLNVKSVNPDKPATVEKMDSSDNVQSPPLCDETEQVPVDSVEARIKEEILTKFYFGFSYISAQDFINCNLDLILMGKLEDDSIPFATAQQMVTDYLASYCHWASYASFHRTKHNSAWTEYRQYNANLPQRLVVDKKTGKTITHCDLIAPDPAISIKAATYGTEKSTIDYLRNHLAIFAFDLLSIFFPQHRAISMLNEYQGTKIGSNSALNTADLYQGLTDSFDTDKSFSSDFDIKTEPTDNKA